MNRSVEKTTIVFLVIWQFLSTTVDCQITEPVTASPQVFTGVALIARSSVPASLMALFLLMSSAV